MKRKMKRLNVPNPGLAIPSWIMGKLTDDTDRYDLNKSFINLKRNKRQCKN